MAFSVNTNAGAFAALRNLDVSTALLDRTQSRINTGLKVASAKDDAASYAISQSLKSDVAGYKAVRNSLDRAISETDVALAGAEAISDLLIQMKEKAVAAKDDGLDDTSRTSLNNDYQELLSQITSISSNASFNGRNILTGDAITAITDASGSSANAITKSVTNLTTSALGLDSTDIGASGGTYTYSSYATSITGFAFRDYLTGNTGPSPDNDPFTTVFNEIFVSEGWISSGTDIVTDIIDAGVAPEDVSTDLLAWFNAGDTGWTIQNAIDAGTIVETGEYAIQGGDYINTLGSGGDPDAAVDAIEAAITTVNDVLSDLGSTANRLDIQRSFAGNLSDTIEVGIGNIVDADLALEAANLQAFQTKQQLGLQALSIANQAPQTVLSLFR